MEMLVCILMLSSFLMISLSKIREPDVKHYYFLDDLCLLQSEAILNKTVVTYEKGISFNSMGHINLARTIEFGDHRYTLNLGSGYILVK